MEDRVKIISAWSEKELEQEITNWIRETKRPSRGFIEHYPIVHIKNISVTVNSGDRLIAVILYEGES